MSNLLASQGALPLSPAIAFLKGICSIPNRLYTLPTIDLLHSFYLGPTKQFCDQAFIVLRGYPYADGNVKKGLANTANQRIYGMPSNTGCRGMTPFKILETDRQASYTGKERRLLSPVLWAAVMGLNASVKPEDDPLFISALYLDFMQAELKGINRSIATRIRKTGEIDSLQALCSVVCNHFIQCFNANESTKLHRIMVHLGAHLQGYGNLRVSDKGPNETLHRGVKASYRTTNKRQSEIAPQLLQVNMSAEMRSTGAQFATENHLLLTRDPAVCTKTEENGNRSIKINQQNDQWQDKIAKEVRKKLKYIYKRRASNRSPESVAQELLSSKDGFGRFKYARKKRITISARFEWDRSEQIRVRQTIYAKTSTLQSNERFDCVRYIKCGFERIGMVQGFLIRLPTRRVSHLSGEAVVIVRHFRDVQSVDVNRLIVEKFGYQRVAFESSDQDVRIECVPLYAVIRCIAVLRDMWDVALRYNPEMCVSEISDDAQERQNARFFVAKNVQYTSIGEELLLTTREQ